MNNNEFWILLRDLEKSSILLNFTQIQGFNAVVRDCVSF